MDTQALTLAVQSLIKEQALLEEAINKVTLRRKNIDSISKDIILRLKREYLQGVIYKDKKYLISGNSIVIRDFEEVYLDG